MRTTKRKKRGDLVEEAVTYAILELAAEKAVYEIIFAWIELYESLEHLIAKGDYEAIMEAIQGATLRSSEVIDATVRNAYTEAYYHEIWRIQRHRHDYYKPPKLSEKAVEKFMTHRIDGKTWRDRVQSNTQYTIQQFAKISTYKSLYGFEDDELLERARRLIGEAGESGITYRMTRILRTEVTAAVAEGSTKAYKAEGVEYYRYNSMLDDIVCDECLEMHGRIFPLSDRVHRPPRHPHCRCYITPVGIPSGPLGGDLRGEMTYSDWKKRYCN